MEPHKAEPVIVAKKARVHELAQIALVSAVEQMRLNTRGARAGTDPDYVHQLRVGVRRARVVLRLFRPFIDPVRQRHLTRDLKWILRALGEVRDRDVLLARVRASPTREHAPESLLAVEVELDRQRNRAARSATRALVSKRYTGLVRSLGALARSLGRAETRRAQTRERTKTSSPRARKWAKKRLQKRLERVLALREVLGGTDDVARHELRKELKKLRYTADLVRSLWRVKRVKHYLAAMSDLQDALGAMNDDATGKRLLVEAKQHTQRKGATAHTALVRELDAHSVAQLEPMLPAFDDFARATPFWS